MKRISKKEASKKYGIITSGINYLYEYYLCDNGCVVDSDGDVRYISKNKDIHGRCSDCPHRDCK